MSSVRFALFRVALPSLAFAETVFITTGDISGAYSQCASCGNPGQALSTTFNARGTSDMDVGLLNTGFVYTPSTQGGIALIDASVDNSTSPIFNISANLLASDFDQIAPTTGVTTSTSHPNFAGDTMEFGLIVSDGSITLPLFTQTIIYNNLAIDLFPTPAALAGLAILRHTA